MGFLTGNKPNSNFMMNLNFNILIKNRTIYNKIKSKKYSLERRLKYKNRTNIMKYKRMMSSKKYLDALIVKSFTKNLNNLAINWKFILIDSIIFL